MWGMGRWGAADAERRGRDGAACRRALEGGRGKAPIPDQSGFVYFYNLFIKFGLMGWICFGFAFLNTLYKYKIHRFFDFVEKSAFEPGQLFLRKSIVFELVIFLCFFAEPLFQNVRIDHRILFIFRKMRHHCKLQVGSWFGGFPWFSISLLIWIIYKGNQKHSTRVATHINLAWNIKRPILGTRIIN